MAIKGWQEQIPGGDGTALDHNCGNGYSNIHMIKHHRTTYKDIIPHPSKKSSTCKTGENPCQVCRLVNVLCQCQFPHFDKVYNYVKAVTTAGIWVKGIWGLSITFGSS